MRRYIAAFISLSIFAGVFLYVSEQYEQEIEQEIQKLSAQNEQEIQQMFNQKYIDPLTGYIEKHQKSYFEAKYVQRVREERDRRCKKIETFYQNKEKNLATFNQVKDWYSYSCPDVVEYFAKAFNNKDEQKVQKLFSQKYIDPLTGYIEKYQDDDIQTEYVRKVRKERDKRCKIIETLYQNKKKDFATLTEVRNWYRYSCPQFVVNFATKVRKERDKGCQKIEKLYQNRKKDIATLAEVKEQYSDSCPQFVMNFATVVNANPAIEKGSTLPTNELLTLVCGGNVFLSTDRRTFEACGNLFKISPDMRQHQVHTLLTNANTYSVFSPDGNLLATRLYGDELVINLFDANTGKLLHTLNTNRIRKLAFSNNGEILWVLKGDPQEAVSDVQLFSTKTGELLRSLGENFFPDVVGSNFSKNGEVFALKALRQRAGRIKLFEMNTGKLLYIQNYVFAHLILISPDARLLLTDNKLWEVNSGKLLHTLPAGFDDAKFSPKGRFIVRESDEKSIELWNVDTGKLQHTVQIIGSRDSIQYKFSPDERIFAVAVKKDDDAYVIKLFDVKTGKLRQTLQSQGSINFDFSPNGRIIAQGGYDAQGETVNFWNVDTGELLQVHIGKTGLRNVIFPLDELLITVGDDKITLWH